MAIRRESDDSQDAGDGSFGEATMSFVKRFVPLRVPRCSTPNLRARAAGVAEIDAWFARYRRFWATHLDALERALTKGELQ